jgi:hypothetical protein
MSSLEQCYCRIVVTQLQDTKRKETFYGSGLHYVCLPCLSQIILREVDKCSLIIIQKF